MVLLKEGPSFDDVGSVFRVTNRMFVLVLYFKEYINLFMLYVDLVCS